MNRITGQHRSWPAHPPVVAALHAHAHVIHEQTATSADVFTKVIQKQ